MAAGVMYPTMQESHNWGSQLSETRGMFMGTPEIYFAKRIDNSRVVRIVDPKRRREMLTFGVTLTIFFLMVMVYRLPHRAGKGRAPRRRGEQPRVEARRVIPDRSAAHRS